MHTEDDQQREKEFLVARQPSGWDRHRAPILSQPRLETGTKVLKDAL